MLIFESDNYKAIAVGSGKLDPTKVHRNVTISTNGVKNETYVRNIRNIPVTISEMKQAEYDKLLLIFEKENEFSFTDTERVIEGNSYFIDQDSFSLNEIEDKSEKGYYYAGSFTISKY